MKKKIFAVSDIHGDYTVFIKSLKEEGYNENDENNLLVVCGDIFDRGIESLAVYEYLKRLTDEGKAIVIRGNHDTMFIDYLKGKSITPFNYIYNGTRETFADFLHQTAPFETWWALNDNEEYPSNIEFTEWLKKAVNEINTEYPELLPWLESLPYYYETDNYIFTHGAIDTKVEDWHKPKVEYHNMYDWEALTWDNGSFFGKHIPNTSKKVVIGHFSTRHLRQMYDIHNVKDKDLDGILYREDGKVIAIDACTTLTHKVNVLVVEDEI